MQVPVKVRRIVVVTVIAALATLFHLVIEGRWFSLIICMFSFRSPNWLEHFWGYSAASLWHEAWIFLACWLVTYLLLTPARLPVASRCLGFIMTSVALIAVVASFLPSSVANVLEGVLIGADKVGYPQPGAGVGPSAILAMMCLAGWQLGRLGASGSRSARAAYLWVALWLLGCGFIGGIMWGMFTYGESYVEVAADIVIWSLWCLAAGIFLAWRRTAELASLEPDSKVPPLPLYRGRYAFSAAVAAVTLTLFHLFVEAMWFPFFPLRLLDMPDATWLARAWVSASPSYWHIGWVLVLSWLAVYLLLTRRKRP